MANLGGRTVAQVHRDICGTVAGSQGKVVLSEYALKQRGFFMGPVMQFGVYLGRTGGQINEAFNHSVPYIGFDSFVGLPNEVPMDGFGGVQPRDWRRRGYAVLGFNVRGKAIDNLLPAQLKKIRATLGASRRSSGETDGDDRIELIRGFYNASLTADLAASLLVRHGAVSYVDVDCDLYISSIQAMDWLFANKLVAPGTVFGYDDWYTKPCLQFVTSSKVRETASEIQEFGGEARAHVEIARKYQVAFECICGPCSFQRNSSLSRSQGHRPYFVVRSIGQYADTGYHLHGVNLRTFLRGSCAAKNPGSFVSLLSMHALS